MTLPPFDLAEAQIGQLFPFYVVLDRHLAVVRGGPRWQASDRRLDPDTPFFDAFQLLRPSVTPTFETLLGQPSPVCVLRHHADGLMLQGSFCAVAQGTHLLFLASPHITDPQDVARFRLSLGDLSQQQGAAELLFLLQTQRRTLTEAQALTHRLAASERRLEATMGASLDPVVSTDATGRILTWNRAAEELFGWAAPEVVGREVAAVLVPDDHRHAHRSAISRRIAGGVSRVINQRLEVSALHRNGSLIPVELMVISSARPASDSDGQSEEEHLTAFIRDLRPQREMEDRLKRDKERAEQEAAAQAEFVAIVSHEIRTPLNGIVGAVDLAIAAAKVPEARDFLYTARRSADALMAIINEVLDYSKLRARSLPIIQESFEPHRMVDEVAAWARPVMGRDVGFGLTTAPDIPRVAVGDAQRISQILKNLVGNAAKFTEAGTVALSMTGTRDRDSLFSFRFVVEDTGPGISPALQAQLFKPFVTGDHAATRRHGGTGLGLAVSAMLAESMGGHLRLVRSSPRGSVFEFEVSLDTRPERRKETLPSSRERRSSVQAQLMRPAGRLSGRVLVVDDNPVNRQLVSAMLRRLGCEVTLAESGPEALSLLEAQAFDAVLMDCFMPEMDGYEVTRRLRAARLGPERLPIVAMTAAALPADRDAALAAGMNAHLAKPFRERQLYETLAPLLTQDMPAAAQAPTDRETPPALQHPDEQRIEEVLSLMGDQRAPIVAAFIESATRQAAELRRLSTNPSGALRVLHDLKGTAGMLGIDSLASVAAESLERLPSTTPDDADWRARVESVCGEIDTAVRLLSAPPFS